MRIDQQKKKITFSPSTVRGSDRCKLFCRIESSSAYYLLSASVVDGTPCGPDTFDACVNGQCIPAGCDHVLGSGKQLGKYCCEIKK